MSIDNKGSVLISLRSTIEHGVEVVWVLSDYKRAVRLLALFPKTSISSTSLVSTSVG